MTPSAHAQYFFFRARIAPEEFLHSDEMTFQVIHQASELLLKGVAWELDRARGLIAMGDFSNSAALLSGLALSLMPAIFVTYVSNSLQALPT